MSARARRSREGGFTLMETLVMLMLVSMAAAMMFQMVDGYRVAHERIAAQAGVQDRAGLLEAWFADTTGGLFPDPVRRFAGTATRLEGVTLDPLFGAAGAPAAFAWSIDAQAGRIDYAEDGQPRWSLPVREPVPRFVYFADDGAPHDRWPPALGMQDALPAAVALVRGEGAAQEVRYVAVKGPREPRVDPFELERE